MKSAWRVGALLVVVCLSPLTAHAWKLDPPDHPAGTWGYNPGTKAEAVNPPAFTWRPAKRAEQYELRVCESLAADRVVYQAQRIRWSSHVPPVPLPENTALHWNIRAYREGEGWSNWSRPIEFMIASGATQQPKPDERELQARIPQSHPRLFLRPEGLDPLRKRIKEDLAEHWKTTLAEAEAVLAKPPDISEPPLYPEGIGKGDEEYKRIWWGNRLRAIALTEAAAKSAFVYRMRLDGKYKKLTRDLMMAFVEWDPKGSTQFEYNDEAAMPLLYWPARAYTWGYDCFTTQERQKIIAVMRVRGQDCYNNLRKQEHLWRPYDSHSNRAWHKLAELAVAFQTEIPEAREWLDYAMTIYYSCYPVWGGHDGGWHEGVSYWTSYMGRFQYWAATMKISLSLDPFSKPFFKETGYYPMYTMPPGSKAGAWGDLAQNSSPEKLASVMGVFAAATGNPYWEWYAKQAGFKLEALGWFGLILASQFPNAPAPAPPIDLPASRVFPDTGLAAFNTNLLDGANNVQVHFKSSAWGTHSHGYNANNSFMLYVNGNPLLTLTGARDVHGSPHHAKWMWESKSDNAILINDTGQVKHSARALGKITQYALNQNVERVEGDASGSYEIEGARWIRRLYFFKPGLLLLHDRVGATAPSTYQWMLHSMAPFRLRDQGAHTEREGTEADVEFLLPQGLALRQTDQFDPPPYEWSKIDLKQWHLRAETNSPAVMQDFVVAIRINGATPSVSCSLNGETCRMRVGLSDGTQYTFDSAPGAPLALTLTEETGAAPPP